MKIKGVGESGTSASGDIRVKIEPGWESATVEIILRSTVEGQFGRQIRKVIMDTLERFDVSGVRVTAVDKGALDYVIRARVLAALCRAAASEDFDWSGA